MNIKYIKTTDNTKYDLRDKRITDTDTGIATQSANGLLSSGDKKKLDGIASGAEVNQNAFSNIKIGDTTISADGKTDTVELTAGNNITLTPDAANDKITIASTDTKVTQRLFTRDGLMPLLFAAGQHNDTTTDITDIAYRNNSIYVLPSQGWIFANRFMGNLEGNVYGTAYEAHQLENTTSVGSETQPVYFKQGVPTACSYQLNKTVPSDAVFTDTDTKVTSAANHYAPSTVSGQDKSASASGGTAGWSIDVVKGVTLNTDGKGHVTGLSVTSAKLPANPVSSSAVTGTGLKVDKIVVGNGGSTVKTSDKGITETAPSSSSDDTTVPTSKAVWTAVSNGIAVADAMIYRGTIAGGSTGAYGALTPFANNGWTYKVTTAGKIDGKAVEIGDMLICNTDGTSAATSSNYSTIADNWDVIQANIDGAVTGPSSSTNAHVAVFDGSTGKVIKDSGYTIGKSVPSDAVFTDTHYTTHLYAGSGTAANAATTNGNTKLTVVDNTTTRNSVTIKGTGGTTVTSDANGVVTIDSTDTSCKQFTFYSPSKEDDGYYFTILPNGYDKAAPTGTCYFIEITVFVAHNGQYSTNNTKFMTHCLWFYQDAGLRITEPIYKTQGVPILYHDTANGAKVGNETGYHNVCAIPFRLEPSDVSLVSVNIKVEGPDVSRCICNRSYNVFDWSSVEPSWTVS